MPVIPAHTLGQNLLCPPLALFWLRDRVFGAGMWQTQTSPPYPNLETDPDGKMEAQDGNRRVL